VTRARLARADGFDARATDMVRRLIEDLVRAHGRSIAQVAKKAGMNPVVLASWIRGDRRPAAADLLVLLMALGHRPTIVLDEPYAAVDAAAGAALRRAGWTPPAAPRPLRRRSRAALARDGVL
jgi:transcriptional regulator with XRE-family HTH domain